MKKTEPKTSTDAEKQILASKIATYLEKLIGIPKLKYNIGETCLYHFDICTDTMSSEKNPELFGIFARLLKEAKIRADINEWSETKIIKIFYDTNRTSMEFESKLSYDGKNLKVI